MKDPAAVPSGMQNKNIRMAAAASLLFSPLGYLQWGSGQHAFLAEVEWQLLTGQTGGDVWQHPLVLIPLLGQLLLLAVIIRPGLPRAVGYAGVLAPWAIHGMVLLGGLLALKPATIASTLPFAAASIWLFRLLRQRPAVPEGVPPAA